MASKSVKPKSKRPAKATRKGKAPSARKAAPKARKSAKKAVRGGKQLSVKAQRFPPAPTMAPPPMLATGGEKGR
jgi:hypothetical protein